ncbi:hypothetical protein ABZ618_29920 [Streptomyces roseolus]|uniref:amidohydrolase family protein n=1 Tax=Streptomyces roseolus TaxID=67358 RepID=UPI0033EFE075
MPSSAGTVLVADRFWDGMSDKPSGHVEVAVRDGRIAGVGPRVDRSDARVVELGDRLLMPGLIDCRVHTTLAPSDMESFITHGSTEIALSILPVLRDFLGRGFTTVRDLGAFTDEPITVYLHDAVRAGLIVAPRLISARGAHGDATAMLAPLPLPSPPASARRSAHSRTAPTR